MLEPRRTDISTLFFVFIVLPLVTYFLLGKWSEASMRKERTNLIAKRAAEEALRVEDMAVVRVIPVASVPNDGRHQCGKCSGPATTRCSQCKSVWYCSGSCQITHWRQVHKFECQQLANNCHVLSPKRISLEESRAGVSHDETVDPNPLLCDVKEPNLEKTKAIMKGISDQKSKLHENSMVESEHANAFIDMRFNGILNSMASTIDGINACDSQMGLSSGEHPSQKGISYEETRGSNCSIGRTSMERGDKARNTLHPCQVELQKSQKSLGKRPKDIGDKSSVVTAKDDVPLHESSRVANSGILRMMGLTKSVNHDHERHSEDCARKQNKFKASSRKQS